MKQWVDYRDFPELFVDVEHPLVMSMIELLPSRKADPGHRIYLFDDSCAPWNGAANARRLEEILRIFVINDEYS
jgi:hypothetical protein